MGECTYDRGRPCLPKEFLGVTCIAPTLSMTTIKRTNTDPNKSNSTTTATTEGITAEEINTNGIINGSSKKKKIVI